MFNPPPPPIQNSGGGLRPPQPPPLVWRPCNQACCVKWNSKNSTEFFVSNGVKPGKVISPILFTAYMDKLLKQLKCNGIGCHIGPVYADAFGYADDVALVVPSLYSLKCMIATCEEFAKKHQITFNPTKSKL